MKSVIPPLLLAALLLAPIAQAETINLELPPGMIEIRHNREDLRLDKMWVAVYCLREDRSSSGGQDCAEIRVDGELNDGLIEFSAADPNRVTARPISIRFDRRSGDVLCIGMKAIFAGHPNQSDSALYVDNGDRYSLLSYCTIDTLPPHLERQPRWAHRRAPSFEEFIRRYASPIELQLRPAP